MASVLKRLAATDNGFESRLCVTGQHRAMLDQVLNLFAIDADHDLNLMKPGQSLTDTTCGVLRGLSTVLAEERPDWVLVQGDTTTAMAASLAAFYHNIPVGHVEAGLRTYDIGRPFPEEANRRITGVVGAAHFAPTEWAADNLRNEGVPLGRIFVTGNTVIDALRLVADIPLDIAKTPLAGLPTDSRLVLVTVHRRENFGRPLFDICSALRTLVQDNPDIHIVLPVHPNPNVQGPIRSLLSDVRNISLLPPLDYHPLVWLLSRCYFCITDSGGIQEEATGVGTPVLVLRDSTERPEGVAAGTARLVGADPKLIVDWGNRLLNDAQAYAAMSKATRPYGNGYAADRIVEVLMRESGYHGVGTASVVDGSACDDTSVGIDADLVVA